MTDLPQTDNAQQTLEVTTRLVSCNGGGVLGHPKVYMDMGQENTVQCKYCDKIFVLKK